MLRILQILVLLLLSTTITLAQNTKGSVSNSYQARSYFPLDSISKYKALSIAAHRRGEIEKFKEYSGVIYQIAKQNELKEEQILALVYLAIYYQETDQYPESLSRYLEAEKLSNTLPENAYSKLLVQVNLGNLYNHIEDYEKVKSSMKKVIALAIHQENTETITISAYNSLGTANLKQGDYVEALDYMHKVKDYAEKLGRNDKIIGALINIAECHRYLGDYHKAIDNGKKALEKIDTQESIELKASANVIIGISYYLAEQPTKALPYLKKAEDIAEKGTFLNIKMEAHQYLAKTYETMGSIKNSLSAQKMYIETRERYLKTLSKAQRLKLEKESETKSVIITEQEKSIAFLSKEKQWFAIVGTLLMILLIVSLIIYWDRRKKWDLESLQLKGDKTLLKNENEALKDKLKILAQNISRKDMSGAAKVNALKKASFSSEERQKYMTSILNYMEKEKPYLDHEIKQIDIASSLEMSVHLFSEVLNICFQKNFNNFINLYRVDTAKKLIKDPKFEHYKILAIGYEAGFPSKSSFNRVFKKLVGLTPTEYQKNQNIQVSGSYP